MDTTTYIASLDLSGLSATMGAFEMNGTLPGVTLPLYSGGRVIVPCNCRIGGTCTTTMVTRDDADPAPGRKGLTDATASGAQI